MTNNTTVRYTSLIGLVMAMALGGAITIHASEVTGTLSSDTSSNPSGKIGGTVTDSPDSSGILEGTVTSGSGGGGGSSGGGSTVTTPIGTVLGEATSNNPSPNFPNTGVAPKTHSSDQPLWSIIMNSLFGIFSF